MLFDHYLKKKIRSHEGEIYQTEFEMQKKDLKLLQEEGEILNSLKGQSNIRLQSIGDGVIVIVPDGKIIYTNEESEKQSCLPADGICDKTLSEIFHTINEQKSEINEISVENSLPNSTVSGQSNYLLLISHDGNQWSSAKIGTSMPGKKNTNPVIIVFQENPLTMLEERTFLDNETRYRHLFESVQNGILILEGDTGTIIDANTFIIEMLGYTLEELIGKKIWEIGFIRDKELTEETIEELKINKCIRYDDIALMAKDGRTIDVELISNLYNVDNKKLIQCNIRNITDHKRAEIKRNSSEIRYRRLFETAQDGILILDGEAGTIIDANPFIIDLLGFTLEELTGKEIWEIGFIRDKELAENAASDLKINKYVRYEDLPLETKDGRSVDVEFVSNVYIVNDRKIIQCNIRDITIRKLMETEISIALKEKEVLLKEIHHRVKNNIQVISSLLKIQSQQSKDPVVKGIFLETNTKVKGIALIHEMLYQSKNLSDIDYAAYLKNITTFVFHSYNVNPLQIGLIIDAEGIMVGIDKAIPLSLIINELLTNALKYAFPGNRKGEIYIEIRQKDENLILTFSDNGIGLSPSVTFDKQDTLGMALLAGLTHQLGGSISVDRVDGTEYTILFPINDEGE